MKRHMLLLRCIKTSDAAASEHALGTGCSAGPWLTDVSSTECVLDRMCSPCMLEAWSWQAVFINVDVFCKQQRFRWINNRAFQELLATPGSPASNRKIKSWILVSCHTLHTPLALLHCCTGSCNCLVSILWLSCASCNLTWASYPSDPSNQQKNQSSFLAVQVSWPAVLLSPWICPSSTESAVSGGASAGWPGHQEFGCTFSKAHG